MTIADRAEALLERAVALEVLADSPGVAHLAVAGASNREIARDLYVSTKTVETHLSHVYAKLGLAGRRARSELGAALALQGPAAAGPPPSRR